MAQAARRNWKGETQLRYQQVYQYIVDLIVEHDLQAGDKLPKRFRPDCAHRRQYDFRAQGFLPNWKMRGNIPPPRGRHVCGKWQNPNSAESDR